MIGIFKYWIGLSKTFTYEYENEGFHYLLDDFKIEFYGSTDENFVEIGELFVIRLQSSFIF